MARVADVSTAGDYAWVRHLPTARATANAGLPKRTRTNCAASRVIYGAMARTSLTMRVTIDDDFTPMSAFEQSFPQHARLEWARCSRKLTDCYRGDGGEKQTSTYGYHGGHRFIGIRE